uniref:Uncharacterized protein n=1 Tax=Rhizophora mucronata TaxID=61149 RepID=A0A2P2NSG8_RHIMU
MDWLIIKNINFLMRSSSTKKLHQVIKHHDVVEARLCLR